MLLPRIQTTLLLLLSVFLVVAAAADAHDKRTVEKRQTSSAPSFRFSVHTHAESAIKYSISPGYVSLMIGGAGMLVAGLMM